MFPKPVFSSKDTVTQSETLWVYVARRRPKTNYVTTVGNVSMVSDTAGTVADDGGFLALSRKVSFLQFVSDLGTGAENFPTRH